MLVELLAESWEKVLPDGLFMASVVAIMIADYWLLTKGNVFVPYLYVSPSLLL